MRAGTAASKMNGAESITAYMMRADTAASKMKGAESITAYMMRAGTAASKIKTAGEIVGDSLLIAVCLKWLPDSFRPFSTEETHKDEMDFSNLKVSLRDYEESGSARVAHCDTNDNIFHVDEVKISFLSCGKLGHKVLVP